MPVDAHVWRQLHLSAVARLSDSHSVYLSLDEYADLNDYDVAAAGHAVALMAAGVCGERESRHRPLRVGKHGVGGADDGGPVGIVEGDRRRGRPRVRPSRRRRRRERRRRRRVTVRCAVFLASLSCGCCCCCWWWWWWWW